MAKLFDSDSHVIDANMYSDTTASMV